MCVLVCVSHLHRYAWCAYVILTIGLYCKRALQKRHTMCILVCVSHLHRYAWCAYAILTIGLYCKRALQKRHTICVMCVCHLSVYVTILFVWQIPLKMLHPRNPPNWETQIPRSPAVPIYINWCSDPGSISGSCPCRTNHKGTHEPGSWSEFSEPNWETRISRYPAVPIYIN